MLVCLVNNGSYYNYPVDIFLFLFIYLPIFSLTLFQKQRYLDLHSINWFLSVSISIFTPTKWHVSKTLVAKTSDMAETKGQATLRGGTVPSVEILKLLGIQILVLTFLAFVHWVETNKKWISNLIQIPHVSNVSTSWDSILPGWRVPILLLCDLESVQEWWGSSTSCRLFTLSSEQDGSRTNMLSFPMVYFISRICACSSSMKPILNFPFWFIIFTVFFSFCTTWR